MEQTILVCDVCGIPATTTVTVRVDGKSLQKDLCADHLGELVQGTRAARPGRRRSPGPTPARRRSTSAAAAKRRTSKKSTAATRPRRGRRPRAAPEPPSAAPAAEGGSGA